MIIKVKVIANSGREEISPFTPVKALGEKISSIPSYKIYLKKQAVDGKANLELLKFLKKEFKKDIRIIKGSKSCNKIIEIEDN